MTELQWTELTSDEQVESIPEESQKHPVLIFKHSTRCSISKTVLNRLERNWKNDHIKTYYLDLLAHRPLSNRVAEYFQVHHESPQALLFNKGKLVLVRSHFDIQPEELLSAVIETKN
ncbi:MAG: Pyridoxamine 5'-phosphate oxidase [Cytophagales bacterium]|jgi:bacillithiol system protein YtxJ|nr:bacillithiol system redox-active protein YtxJ [Bacteroidota bacterium]MBS1979681.1 bacillithiol system redox-active protein YtxJ [Bacteroidota bacterium]WHZ06934.1 MAG: Pyridoxamine 5'-phosphate oxidase [Cytophagales bacterium]